MTKELKEKNYGERLGWTPGKDFPLWGNNEVYVQTISNGYLYEEETPRDAYMRVSKTIANRINQPELSSKFFDYIWKGWLCLATPVLSNTGTMTSNGKPRGLTISCFGIKPDDSVDSIGQKTHELMMLTKAGGGVGVNVNDIRPTGSEIRGNGTSDGAPPFCHLMDTALLVVNQGRRRGSGVFNFNINHDDFDELINLQNQDGAREKRKALGSHSCVVIEDSFMERLLSKEPEAMRRWRLLMIKCFELGEPYILFKDNVNKANPLAYTLNDLTVDMTNLCCLTGDTPILTREGVYAIKDLVGKKVTIWDGKEWVANNSFEFKGVDHIYEVILADGTILKSNENHRWFITKDNDTQEKLTPELKVGDYIELHKEVSSGNIDITDAFIRQFLSSQEYEKTGIPVEVWGNWSINSKVKLLLAMFKANNNLTTKSEQLAKDMQLMLKSLGYIVSLNKDSEYYKLYVSQQDSINYEYSNELKTVLETCYRECNDWNKVVSIKKTDITEEVYCSKVESTGKFALANGLMTGNSEIMLFCDELHSFVCCLSSLNLARWDEWRKTDLPYIATLFLDGVLEEFLYWARQTPGLENAVRFAEKSRALGLGVLGYHSLLQEKGLPYGCFEAINLSNLIMKTIREAAELASQDLAIENGEPEWCKGTGRANTHLIAIAPTESNAKNSGDVSPSAEPWPGVEWTPRTAKGIFHRKNPQFVKFLDKINLNNADIWNQVTANSANLENIKELDNWYFVNGTPTYSTEKPENSYHCRDVFKRWVDIDHSGIIQTISTMQKHVDQGISLNLQVSKDMPIPELSRFHIRLWQANIKSRYYIRSQSRLKGDGMVIEKTDECIPCSG